MAKDPAFLFYPNDWLGGTMGMSFEEKGAYMELLILQFNRGHMTSHLIGQAVGQIWDKIQDKFIQDEKGLYYNVRLDEEKNRRKLFTDSRKNNLKGVNQYTKKSGHMTSHMENENRIEVRNELGKRGVGKNQNQINFSEVFNSQWMESVYRNGFKGTYDELMNYWHDFQNEMSARDDLYRTKEEYRKHFPSWVKKQVNGTGFKSKVEEVEDAFRNV